MILAAAVEGDGLHLTGWQVVLAIGEMAIIGWVLTRAIIATSKLPPPAMVTTALAVLTLVAMGGLILTRNEILGTLAATGLGALAGAVTALFNTRGRKGDGEDDDGEQR